MYLYYQVAPPQIEQVIGTPLEDKKRKTKRENDARMTGRVRDEGTSLISVRDFPDSEVINEVSTSLAGA